MMHLNQDPSGKYSVENTQQTPNRKYDMGFGTANWNVKVHLKRYFLLQKRCFAIFRRNLCFSY